MMERAEFEREKDEILRWSPPTEHQIEFKRRVFQIEEWIRISERLVPEEEVVAYAMKHFLVQKKQAREYLHQVVEDFRKRGVPVIDA